MIGGSEPTDLAVRVLRRSDVIRCLAAQEVLDAVREALVAVARGQVTAPAPMSFGFPRARGEAHVKGAYLEGSSDWAVKVATGFYGNRSLGLPTSAGLSLVCSGHTGLVHTVVADGGHLTDVRTGAAGALAATAFTRRRIRRVGIVGTGLQARVQLEYLLHVRQVGEVVAFGRDRARADSYAAQMNARFGVGVRIAADLREVVDGSELVITATPSERPLIRADWVRGPTAFVAVGSDMPAKQELDAALLECAEMLVADDPGQAMAVGELHHAPEAAARAGWLGELLADPNSQALDGIRIADLTGLGAEDAAVAGVVARRARELGLGELIELD